MKRAYHLSLVLLMIVWPPGSDAADAQRKYAVLSLVGDSLNLVTHRPAVGTRVDPNIRDTVALSDTVFDDTALLTAEKVLRSAPISAGAPALLATSGPAAYADSRTWVNGQKFSAPKWLDEALKAERATHLLLITKYRAEPRFQSRTELLGAGWMEGLGFFIDRLTPTRRTDTGESGIGFLAPYAYFKIALIDLSSSTLVKEHRAAASYTISAAASPGGASPWDVLSNAEKIDTLKALIGSEIEKALPALVQGP